MKQVVQHLRTGELQVVEVPEPAIRDGHVLVRTSASLISAGTERMIVDFANKSLVGKARTRPDLVRKVIDKARRDGVAATLRTVMARLDEPLPLGYSAAGAVTAVGAGLEGRYRVGQRVALAGAGAANHAEVNAVPAPLVAPVPDDVGDDEAAFGTVAAIALHGVRNLNCGLGDIVAVVGAGLVGLLAIQLLTLSGARVIALDINPDRLSLARRLGAEWVFRLDETLGASTILAATGNRGADGILVAAATDSSEPLSLASQIARDRARICLVGKTGTEFPFADFMKKELSLVVSRSYGPGRYDDDFESGQVKYPPGFVRWTETENLAECLRLMSRSSPRRLAVDELITQRFPIGDAEAAYRLVLDGGTPHLGVLLVYSDGTPPVVRPSFQAAPAGAGRCSIGMIGAGSFAHAVLLPALQRIEGATLQTVVTSRGMTAEHTRARFRFARAGTDPRLILDDPSIDAVMIATPHAQHASLVCDALAAGKAVFVEKPLALTRDELSAVSDARRRAGRFFMVGFNRRFAPLTRKALDALRGLPGPRFVVTRVNAGPSETKERILGEMCHFVDLARCLVGAPIRSVQAASAIPDNGSGADDVSATLSFGDGSVATIVYTGLGDASFGKEMIEVYAAGTVVRIDEFRSCVVVANGRTVTQRSRAGQDKGHAAEMAAFVAAVHAGGEPPVSEAELIESSLATLAVLESLQTGQRIDL
jgi:predicted dehydrogenase